MQINAYVNTKHGVVVLLEPSRLSEAEKVKRLCNAAPGLLRIACLLESYRVAGADTISFSALMHDGDDTLGEAVRAAIAKAGG
jgi:hypothetical protein